MPGDTVADLRQRAGDLAHRLGSLSHFIPAAQELLDIIYRLTSEILLRHNRKIVTLVEISRATLTRAGLRLNSFTSFIPALRNYKALYFDILRAIQERQEFIVDSDDLRDRVGRLLKPLSSWLVIQQQHSSSVRPLSAPVSPSKETTYPPPLDSETSQLPKKSVPTRRLSQAAHPATAPEDLMPPPSALPHRFQQPPSTTSRGRHPAQADQTNQSCGAIRMARTRSPRQLPCAELQLETPPAEPPEAAALPPVVAQRMTQRFGIFCTTTNGSGGRRSRLAAPRSIP